jgi:hypothetical protein
MRDSNLKSLAISVLSRHGKRDTDRDSGGTNLSQACPTDPQYSGVSGTKIEEFKTTPQRLEWESETAGIIEWFMNAVPPSTPFDLYPYVKVLHPHRFWEAIRRDIAAGPGVARAYYGALQKDLRRLAELFGGPVNK